MGIGLPPRLDVDQGELTIHLDPSLAVTTVDALDYLKNFPHQCIEQTISRFLPNVMTYRALKNLGIDDPDLAANLRNYIAGFSQNMREVLEKFDFDNTISKLDEAGLLFQVLERLKTSISIRKRSTTRQWARSSRS